MSKSQEQVVDVVVVGSGAAGIAAALTAAKGGADVLVIEKADQLGGTSAWSGGELWVPCNDVMAAAGIEDSREEALEYIFSLNSDRMPNLALVEKFVDTGAEAITFLSENSAYHPHVAPMADYYADRPGGKTGRSLAPDVLNAKEVLGDWWDKVRDSPLVPPISDEEYAYEWAEKNLPSHPRKAEDKAVPEPDLSEKIADRRANGIRFMGPALVSGLLRGALDAGVRFEMSTPADRLILEGGRVAGVVAINDSDEITLRARRGVVLATGGFEHNPELVLAYLGLPEIFPMSPATNVGDGLQMGLESGAAVANMSVPMTFPAHWDGVLEEDGKPLVMPSAQRNDPGTIIVNQQGKRFANEGICYMDVGKMYREFDEFTATYPNTPPVWHVFDHTARLRSYDVGPGPTPDWVHEAPTIAELAALIGVDGAVLEDEVQRFNSHVDAGHDPDFRRGEIWWEGALIGGPGPEKNMSKIETGPFYAFPLQNGVAVTQGGLRIDTDARVIAARGGVIEGLYAVGAVAASIFGETYPGSGSTLGPNMTFGYIAGRHVAQAGSTAA